MSSRLGLHLQALAKQPLSQGLPAASALLQDLQIAAQQPTAAIGLIEATTGLVEMLLAQLTATALHGVAKLPVLATANAPGLQGLDKQVLLLLGQVRLTMTTSSIPNLVALTLALLRSQQETILRLLPSCSRACAPACCQSLTAIATTPVLRVP